MTYRTITHEDVLRLHRIMAADVMDQGTAGKQLLQPLRDHKSMSPIEIWAALGVSRQGAMDLLNPLIEAGMVKRIGSKKSGQYILS